MVNSHRRLALMLDFVFPVTCRKLKPDPNSLTSGSPTVPHEAKCAEWIVSLISLALVVVSGLALWLSPNDGWLISPLPLMETSLADVLVP